MTDPNAEAAAAEEQPTFDVLPLSPEVRKAVDDLGYTHPTPVQKAVFESVASGRDVVVQARTGTGKTAAFGLPVVDRLVDTDSSKSQVLVLSPTRELALQINRELENLSKYKDVTCTAVYGGAAMQPQINAIKNGTQVIAGTPGRVLDHLERGTLNPKDIKALVLDESDEMLSMGFLPQITKIMEQLPDGHQTLLFSATLPPDVKRIADSRLTDPEFITLSGDHIGALSIDHFVYRSAGSKAEELIQIIEIENPESAIVFCNTREQTKRIAGALQKKGYAADWLNADLAQNDREKVMKATREDKLRFLVCTDVAARGIDISHLTHVINADFPESTENYVHRTGRTGRAGKTGTAISLIAPQDVGNLYMLRLTYKIFPVERDLPRAGDIQTRKEADLVNFLHKAFSNQPVLPADQSLARRILTSDVAETIVAGLLRDHLGTHPKAEEESAQARRDQAPDKPLVSKRSKKKDKLPKKEKPKKAKKRDDTDEEEVSPKSTKKDAEKSKKAADKPKKKRSEEKPKKRSEPAELSDSEEKESKPRKAKKSDAPKKAEAKAEKPKRAISGPAARKRAAEESAESDPSKMEVVSASDLLSASERALLRGDSEDGGDEATESPRKERRAKREDDGLTRIFVDIGKRDDVYKDDFLDTLADNGFRISEVAFVNIRDSHTFVGVPDDLVGDAIQALDGEDVGGLEVMAEKARPPRKSSGARRR